MKLKYEYSNSLLNQASKHRLQPHKQKRQTAKRRMNISRNISKKKAKIIEDPPSQHDSMGVEHGPAGFHMGLGSERVHTWADTAARLGCSQNTHGSTHRALGASSVDSVSGNVRYLVSSFQCFRNRLN